MKKLLITNPRSGSVTLIGSRKINIPGNAVNLEVSLPDVEADDLVKSLKRRYPAMVVKEGGATAKPATVGETVSAAAEPAEKKTNSKTQKAQK